ncbi:MAG: hypothetical protein GF355_14705 [Candidatus Eisenbacteria bacterium]|nr:hypothetical protein [Candidatus Eisenbacteria bacterium]
MPKKPSRTDGTDSDSSVRGEAAPSTNSGNRMVLYLPSSLDYLSVVDKMVDGVTEMLDLNEEDGIAVATSVIEACTNAIQHGHRLEAKKLFQCTFQIGEDRLEVTVKDWGPGFDVDAVIKGDPTGPGGLLRSRGRGIFIMRSMMDDVAFEVGCPEGTTVRMTKIYSRRPNRGGGESA